MSSCREEQKEKIIDMEIFYNSTKIRNKPKDNEAIGDTGTTDHLLKENASVDEIEPANIPIEI